MLFESDMIIFPMEFLHIDANRGNLSKCRITVSQDPLESPRQEERRIPLYTVDSTEDYAVCMSYL